MPLLLRRAVTVFAGDLQSFTACYGLLMGIIVSMPLQARFRRTERVRAPGARTYAPKIKICRTGATMLVTSSLDLALPRPAIATELEVTPTQTCIL